MRKSGLSEAMPLMGTPALRGQCHVLPHPESSEGALGGLGVWKRSIKRQLKRTQRPAISSMGTGETQPSTA